MTIITSLLWFAFGGVTGILLMALVNAAADSERDAAMDEALEELYLLRIERDALACELSKHDPESPI